MSFLLSIPNPNDQYLEISLDIGQSIFVLGANGTGKSSLMQKIYSVHHANSQRISAHRQTWFTSSSVTLSSAEKKNTEIRKEKKEKR